MTKPTYQQAMAEALNHAAPDIVTYDTLEFHHSGLKSPLRVVRGTDDINAKLEQGAIADGDQMVKFKGVPFDIIPPGQGVGPTPQAQVKINNIGVDLMNMLDGLMATFEPIKCVYRAYTNKTLTDDPQLTPPPVLQVKKSGGGDVLNITLSPIDLTKMKFPKETHSAY